MVPKRYCLASLAVLILVWIMLGGYSDGLPLADAQAPTSTPTSSSQITIPQYGLFELALPVSAAVRNVFDPSEIDVTVQFTAPDGTQLSVPGFWMQPYEQKCTNDCTVEVLSPEEQPGWRVRFTPTKPGEWHYMLQERDRISVRTTARGSFTVVPSQRPGFIRVGANHHYFGYDNGMPYFP